jgi:8-oxo-dGTP diphosphatase
MNIRNSAKAIIIEEGKILVTKNRGGDGDFYICPGGGQDYGETLHDALRRECMEELGYTVEIGELLHVCEYIGENEFNPSKSHVHQIEFYFSCTLKEDHNGEPVKPDPEQIGIEWVPIVDLVEYNFYPKELREYIGNKGAPVYFGDMN